MQLRPGQSNRKKRRPHQYLVASVDELVENQAFALSLAYILQIRTGWERGEYLMPYPEDTLTWTLKQISHYGKLSHLGVQKDPGNHVYWIMWLSLVHRLGALVSKDAAFAAGRCSLHDNEPGHCL